MDEYISAVFGIKALKNKIGHIKINDKEVIERIILYCINYGKCSLLQNLFDGHMRIGELIAHVADVLTKFTYVIPAKSDKIAKIIHTVFHNNQWKYWANHDKADIIRTLKFDHGENTKKLLFLEKILKYPNSYNPLYDMKFGDNIYYKYMNRVCPKSKNIK